MSARSGQMPARASRHRGHLTGICWPPVCALFCSHVDSDTIHAYLKPLESGDERLEADTE
jgi:hypothetical protein